MASFDAVVSHYEKDLLRYAARIMNNPSASQDVVQDAFIRLFRHWKLEFVPSPQISSWLYRVVHNCAVDSLRRQARHDLLHTRHADEQPAFAPSNRGEGFEISEAAEQAATALQTLDLRERQLVILKVYEEKSYKEISEITGLTVTNVGYILHHAMKKLAAALKEAKAI